MVLLNSKDHVETVYKQMFGILSIYMIKGTISLNHSCSFCMKMYVVGTR